MQTTAAVIFDMDELMLDTERVSREAWVRAGREMGVEFSHELNARLIGRVQVDIRRILVQEYGPEFDLDAYIERAHEHYMRQLEAGVPVKAGVFEVLHCLESEGLPKAVATSTQRERADYKLAGANLASRFATTVTGDEVTNGKPAPDIFLAAAAKLGVAPERCLVLEDSPMGIAGAFAAGTVPVMIPDLISPSETERAKAFAIYPSLADWLADFRRLRETV